MEPYGLFHNEKYLQHMETEKLINDKWKDLEGPILVENDKVQQEILHKAATILIHNLKKNLPAGKTLSAVILMMYDNNQYQITALTHKPEENAEPV